MNNNDDLKPCPFCGGKATLWEDLFGVSYVSCSCCCVRTPIEEDKHIVIEDWNRRAKMDEVIE